MNYELFEYLVASPVFDKFPELDRKLIWDIMLGPGPTETTSTGGTVTFEGATPKVVSMDDLAVVPTMPRSPRPNPT